MTKKDLLNKYYDMACHNLFCYSKTISEPKDGYEKEWKEALEEVELLKQMIAAEEKKEAAQEVQVPEQQFIGHMRLQKESINRTKKELSKLEMPVGI